MNKTRTAIQGGPASFHDAAARLLHSGTSVTTVPYTTFQGLCLALQQSEVDTAVVAIENTLAGSLLPNYTLLREHHLHAVKEIWLPIDQNLLALPGQRLEDLHTVLSHPVALAQCGHFLQQHPHLQPQETHDTADSARLIQEKQLNGTAAIAGTAAAELYGLEILVTHIADSAQNQTRFLLLQKEQAAIPTEANKAILTFRKPLHTSTLTLLLNLLQKHQVELTLLQTLPSAEERSYMVAELDAAHVHLQQAIAQVRPLVEDMQVIGLLEKAAPLAPENFTSAMAVATV